MTKEELGELIMREQEGFYRIAKTVIYEDCDVGDALSEAIVKAFANLDTLKRDRYAKTWFVRILINECYNILNKRNRLVYVDEEELKASEKPQESSDYSELYLALEELPKEQRLCIALYYMEGYSVKEIASMTESTVSAVKNKLLRGRKKLKELLESPIEQMA